MDVLRISTFIIIIIIIIIAVVRYHLYVGVLQLRIQTNNVFTVYSAAADLYLQFVLHAMFFAD